MEILSDFVPGSIGAIIALHGAHYASAWGFGPVFEARVAAELGQFAARKTGGDLVLLAMDEGGLAASLILDLHDPASGTRGAHLRWFFVAARCRAGGLGRKLLARAMDHADLHASGRVWLTTFAGLHAARHLYEAQGFRLVSEAEGEAWGTRVQEQEFRRQAATG